jgi:hypothetical protein
MSSEEKSLFAKQIFYLVDYFQHTNRTEIESLFSNFSYSHEGHIEAFVGVFISITIVCFFIVL